MNQIMLMAADPNATGSLMTTIMTFVIIILIFYFLIIRPQKKKDKEAKMMIDAMKKGDKVITIGGIHGTVVQVKEQTVVIKVDDSARIEFSKSAISSVIAKEKGQVKKDATKPELKLEKAEEKTEEVKTEEKKDEENK